MKNGIAAVQLSDTVAIFEFVGGEWQRGVTLAPLRYPGGLAISGNRILIGANRCETYGAYLYQKDSNGVWSVSGRLPGVGGPCNSNGISVELDYDSAIMWTTARYAGTFRPVSGSIDWQWAGTIEVPAAASTTIGSMALQKSTAVSSGSAIFRRTGTTWNYLGQLQPVDYGNGTGHAGDVEYRDGVLLTNEGWSEMHQFTKPYLYLENAAGTFDHTGILETSGFTQDFDVSKNTVLAGFDLFGETGVDVFNLPSPLKPPPSIVNGSSVDVE